MVEQDKVTKNMEEMGRAMIDAQLEALSKAAVNQADALSSFLGLLNTFSRFSAVFKTTVQKSGRISIPEAERQALAIKEGDLVQVIIIPLKKV